MAAGKGFRRSEQGFSLVELMIVVGIIGLLATLAVPRFQQFQAKARMAEGKNLLTHMYTLEEAYHLDTNVYLNMAQYGRQAGGALNCTRPQGAIDLGFEINPCVPNGPVPRFGYDVTGAGNDVFTANATTGTAANNLVCPGSTTAVNYSINQLKVLSSNNGGAAMNSCP